ncbi:MAG: DUF924 domain-containing protein [Paracoccaceae bacterium]|nr:DUF924 domain-containing protein [Paracoccaceae bacterium]
MSPDEVLGFWLDKVGQESWYATDEVLDSEIRSRFLKGWNELKTGAFALWLTYPSGACAYIILADQFPRNMFRGSKQAFASDKAGLSAAKSSIKQGWDLRIDEPARQFFYLPLMHSENLYDQDRCVRLLSARMTESGNSNLVHAKAHREVIRQFGRFPYRNVALERRLTSIEREYLDRGGYGLTLRELDKPS